jgi:catechol 2,3-dioxygenase-like lactoylglutathione lyase family enzyme
MVRYHHFSIRTADIHRAIAFYSVLGFQVCERFTTGATLACWMEGSAGRLEFIQIPEPKPAPEAFHDPHFVGHYHLSFDLTEDLGKHLTLGKWLDQFEATLKNHNLPLVRLLAPCLQSIGDIEYCVAFIADPDGLPIEFLHRQTLPN